MYFVVTADYKAVLFFSGHGVVALHKANIIVYCGVLKLLLCLHRLGLTRQTNTRFFSKVAFSLWLQSFFSQHQQHITTLSLSLHTSSARPQTNRLSTGLLSHRE